MIKGESQVSRKVVKEDRIAICPQIGCIHLEKVKPLKFGILGFRKYPKCSEHKIPLIFVEEFIGNLFEAVNTCIFDISSLSPETLIDLIKTSASDELIKFINGWMYCNPIGRGAQVISQYVDGLTRAYIKSLSRKQKKVLNNEKKSKNQYKMLRSGLKKIADDYTTFLKEFREKSEQLYDQEYLNPFSDKLQIILKTWLKKYLNTIDPIKKENSFEDLSENETLSLLKEKYDKILHSETCVILLGKSPTVVVKSISAFELFSAYHEFLEAGLCHELKIKDLKLLIEESEEFLNGNEEEILDTQKENENLNKSINKLDKSKESIRYDEKIDKVIKADMLNFRKKVETNLNILSTIKCTKEQKELIKLESQMILDEFFLRLENNEIKISNKTNPKIIAAAIIYTVIIANETLPKISVPELTGVPKYSISKYYTKYFKEYYTNKNFNFPPYYGFSRIRNALSFYIFDLICSRKEKVAKIAFTLVNDILENINLPTQLSNKDIDLLHSLINNHYDKFLKYLNDLTEVIKQIYGSSLLHKKIGIRLVVKPIAECLYKKDINLFQSFKQFYYSVIEIYDSLKVKFPNAIPHRSKTQYSYNKGAIVIGSRIKLYIIAHIYNGIYNENLIKCPLCLKEGFKTNTDISRLKALDFHHDQNGKEYKYSSSALYEMYMKNQTNPEFLENLIKFMESKKVVLVCASHHDIISGKYFNYFRDLISWQGLSNRFPQNIFSLSPELIHTLVKISINIHNKTKNLSIKQKGYIKLSLISLLKRRYIIESIYGDKCHLCGEFNTKDHLVSFQFNHNNKDTKTLLASDLFKTEALSCSEIVQTLDQEEGGYICANCHSVIDNNTYLNSLNEIYNDKSIAKKALTDYNICTRNFTLLHNKNSIKNPLKLSKRLSDNFEQFLYAIYELSKLGNSITNISIASYLGLSSRKIVSSFFTRNDYMKLYVKINKTEKVYKYSLTKKGVEAVSLMKYFKDYYKDQ